MGILALILVIATVDDINVEHNGPYVESEKVERVPVISETTGEVLYYNIKQ